MFHKIRNTARSCLLHRRIKFRFLISTLADVIGLVGFARLMRGDTFEVTLRYGQQKWKTKGRVGEMTQEWQNDSVTLRALVGDVFNIKVRLPGGITQNVFILLSWQYVIFQSIYFHNVSFCPSPYLSSFLP